MWASVTADKPGLYPSVGVGMEGGGPPPETLLPSPAGNRAVEPMLARWHLLSHHALGLQTERMVIVLGSMMIEAVESHAYAKWP